VYRYIHARTMRGSPQTRLCVFVVSFVGGTAKYRVKKQSAI